LSDIFNVASLEDEPGSPASWGMVDDPARADTPPPVGTSAVETVLPAKEPTSLYSLSDFVEDLRSGGSAPGWGIDEDMDLEVELTIAGQVERPR